MRKFVGKHKMLDTFGYLMFTLVRNI